MDPDLHLTPVKIRGKKRKYITKPVPISLLSGSSTTPSNEAALKARRLHPVNPRKTRKQTIAAMPTLLGLPTELLETIFLYSMNISLPQASPLLGIKLSSQVVTLEYTMQAFFHTFDHKTNFRHRKNSSNPVLQSAVLSCRFFTWSFFLKYVDRAHKAKITLRGKAWKDNGVKVKGIKEFDGLWPSQFAPIQYLGFAEWFHIPEKLLHGPWEEEKAKLLYVLVSLNGEIDWEHSMAGEMAKQGIREAVAEGNERAVAALSTLLGVPRQIDTKLLRYAVLECGCDVSIVRHLLFNAQILAQGMSKDVLDFLDTRLWAWADENGEKGDVLKYMLRKADAFDLEFYFEENSDWNKIVPFPYDGTKFNTRMTLDAAMRHALMNLYRNYGRRILGRY